MDSKSDGRSASWERGESGEGEMGRILSGGVKSMARDDSTAGRSLV